MNKILYAFLLGTIAFLEACSESGSSVNDGGKKTDMYLHDASTVYDEVAQTLTDGRDGQVYKTVVINNRVWMAENLNYKYYHKTARSFCYNADTANCKKYGRLYTWSAALDSAGFFSNECWGCGNGSEIKAAGRVRGVCPDGWHLPNMVEWQDLMYYVGENFMEKLKSRDGWNETPGTDEFGFCALPAGSRKNTEGNFLEEGEYVYFWASSNYHYKGVSFSNARFGAVPLSRSASVRCVKDDGEKVEIPKPDHEIVYGTLKDSRDNHVYKTVEIGDQTWMAENLKLGYPQAPNGTSCPNDNLDSCESYGRLYTWAAAMDSAAVYSKDGEGCSDGMICSPPDFVSGICPQGWHLPNCDEFKKLIQYVGGSDFAGRRLKGIHGWPEYGDGYDLYGFNAVPIKDSIDLFYRGSTENSEYGTCTLAFFEQNLEGVAARIASDKSRKLPIRCLKND